MPWTMYQLSSPESPCDLLLSGIPSNFPLYPVIVYNLRLLLTASPLLKTTFYLVTEEKGCDVWVGGLVTVDLEIFCIHREQIPEIPEFGVRSGP